MIYLIHHRDLDGNKIMLVQARRIITLKESGRYRGRSQDRGCSIL